MRSLALSFCSALLLTSLCFGSQEKGQPEIVAIPPADGGRGLIRVNAQEIRHYSGNRKAPDYLVSKDNGKTWKLQQAPDSYPPNFGGIPKESPDIERNPITKEFIRVQPIGGFVFLSQGGLDGTWSAVTKDGKLEKDWKDAEKRKNLLTLRGIMRSPLFVNKGKRIIIPTHEMGKGTWFHISDDGGLTWKPSKDTITSPQFEVKPPEQGSRWYNNGVEASVVELANGTLYSLVRTSMDQHYESFSKDFGNTWTKSQPSRFFGTLTMPTLGKLDNGTLVALWTNARPLPENKKAGNGKWEDVFTNRDTIHIALSNTNGKTWYGFREILLEEHRNKGDFATMNGPEDRGKHQSQFVQLDKNKILVSLGQHPCHRKLVIVDTGWVGEKTRATQVGKHPEEWTTHTYIPQVKGHCSYNRKASCELVPAPDTDSKKVLQIKRLNAPELVNTEANVDYQNGGATWNFPNGTTGALKFKFRIANGDQAKDSGLHISLMDRLFNACDTNAPDNAIFSFPIVINPSPHLVINGKKIPFAPQTWHQMSIVWVNNQASISLDGKPVGKLQQHQKTPNGISYIHFISTATQPDSGVLLDDVAVKVK
ncbi:MAG: sialidase family protein [Akkermansia sp.]